MYHPVQYLTDLRMAYEEGYDTGEPRFEVFLDFVMGLLALHPDKRMSASEAMEH